MSTVQVATTIPVYGVQLLKGRHIHLIDDSRLSECQTGEITFGRLRPVNLQRSGKEDYINSEELRRQARALRAMWGHRQLFHLLNLGIPEGLDPTRSYVFPGDRDLQYVPDEKGEGRECVLCLTRIRCRWSFYLHLVDHPWHCPSHQFLVATHRFGR